MILFRSLHKRKIHKQLSEARDAADRELRRAVLANDSRSIHAARKAMTQATNALMRHELGIGK